MQNMSMDKILRDLVGETEFKELAHGAADLLEKMGKLQPWSEFFVGFKPPQPDRKYIEQRISTNLVHYRSNYIVICCIVTLLQLILSPLLLLILVIYLCGVFYFLFVMKPSHIQIGEVTITSQGKRYISLVILVILLAITGGFVKLAWTCIYCWILCSIHMVFKPRHSTAVSGTQGNKTPYDDIKLHGFSLPNMQTNYKATTATMNNNNHDPEDPPTDRNGPDCATTSNYGVTSDSVTKRRSNSRVA